MVLIKGSHFRLYSHELRDIIEYKLFQHFIDRDMEHSERDPRCLSHSDDLRIPGFHHHHCQYRDDLLTAEFSSGRYRKYIFYVCSEMKCSLFFLKMTPTAELKTTPSVPTTMNVIKTKPPPNSTPLLATTEGTISPTRLQPTTTEAIPTTNKVLASDEEEDKSTNKQLPYESTTETDSDLNSDTEQNEEETTSSTSAQTIEAATTTTESILHSYPDKEADTTKEAVTTGNTPTLPIENDLYVPEYNLLSRQPSQFVEETYRLVNLKASNKPSSQKSLPPPSTDAGYEDEATESPNKHIANSIPKDSPASGSQLSVSATLTRTQKSNKKNKLRPSSTASPHVLKTTAPLVGGGSRPTSNSNKITNRISNSATTTATATSGSSSSGRSKSHKKSSNRSTSTSSKSTSHNEEVVTVRSTSSRAKPKR